MKAYKALIASIAQTPVEELKPLVEGMLADPAMFTVMQGEDLPEHYSMRLAPLARTFFSQYATAKSEAMNLQLSCASLDEPAPPGYLRIGSDLENSVFFYVRENAEQVAVRGMGSTHTLNFPTIYHFLYAQYRLAKV